MPARYSTMRADLAPIPSGPPSLNDPIGGVKAPPVVGVAEAAADVVVTRGPARGGAPRPDVAATMADGWPGIGIRAPRRPPTRCPTSEAWPPATGARGVRA